jgi:hypothetical protein
MGEAEGFVVILFAADGTQTAHFFHTKERAKAHARQAIEAGRATEATVTPGMLFEATR